MESVYNRYGKYLRELDQILFVLKAPLKVSQSRKFRVANIVMVHKDIASLTVMNKQE